MSDREQKNSTVFGSPMGVDPGIPVMTAIEKMKAELGVEIPIETVPLPSLGKCYPLGHPLNGKESVDIRAMTAREEDILMNRTYLKKNTAITELLKSCLTDRNIDPTSLLSGDRNALLTAIRISGYGPEYPVSIKCSECENSVEHEFDLGALPIRTLDIDPARPNENYFEFTLPYTKKVVGFKFPTGRDEEEATARNDKQKKLNLGVETPIVSQLITAIITLDGSTDRSKIAQFVRMMPARDSLALRTFIKDNDPNIIFKQEMTCKMCDTTSEVVVPLGVSFLWPGAK
jgi:hypothetical protein